MNEKLLASLGLSTGEIKLYRAALKHVAASPAELAKTTGMKRTTAYAIARGLTEKGFLSEDVSRRPRRFSPTAPHEIKTIIAEEKKRFDTREKLLEEFAGELAQSQSEKIYPIPKIRFVEERKLEQFQLTRLPDWTISVMKHDQTWWGFQDHTWVETFGHLIPEYWKGVPGDLQLRFLSNQEDLVREQKLRKRFPRRVIKYWSKTSKFLSSLWIVGDYVVIHNTRHRPFYAYEIHDATLANDLREVFKNLWSLV